MLNNQNSWSEWFDFKRSILSDMPQTEGVFMMHSAMKILFIEGTTNLKKSIEEKFNHPEITENTRLRFMMTQTYKKTAEELIKNYRVRHDGKNPLYMK